MSNSLFRFVINKRQPILDRVFPALGSSSLSKDYDGRVGGSPVVNCKNPIRDFSNCNRAALTRINRLQYLRLYPTLLVNPDGSTFTVRYAQPRQIIKLPVDVSLLSDAARNGRLERRKPRTKVKLEDEYEDESFDAKKYLKFVKK